MGKHKKITRGRFKATANLSSSRKRQVTELEPGELAAYVQRAEKRILPLIKEANLDAAGTQFLLAQYTLPLVTGNAPFDLEGAMIIANIVLALWQEGYYTPSSEYPYTLEETLLCLQEEAKANIDNAKQFRPAAFEKGDYLRCPDRAAETGEEKVG
jgi:hypothetical protein